MAFAAQQRHAALKMSLTCLSVLIWLSACSKKTSDPTDVVEDGGATDILLDGISPIEDSITEDQFIGLPLPQFECQKDEDCYELYDHNDACNALSCDDLTGICFLKPIPEVTVCDDQDVCTVETLCLNGNCVGTQINCDDGNPCTDDSCDPILGCVHTNNTQPCDDENECSLEDACQDGTCVGGTNVCTCETDSDCLPFNDANPCNGTLYCTTEGDCAIAPESVILCEEHENPCLQNVCDPFTATCVAEQVTAGTPCSDGNLCTLDDFCTSGQCTAGPPLDCANNPCSTGQCMPSSGCVIDDSVTDCDDNNPCTSDDTCENGFCVGMTNICNCEIDEDCADVEDNDLCNGTLACIEGTCIDDPNSVVTCVDDDNPCTQPVCQKSSGDCEFVPVPDETSCPSPDLCIENTACSAGSCIGGTNIDCDDNNPCTSELCESEVGCITTPEAGLCDDGDECTENDACTAGLCLGDAIPGCGIPCLTVVDCEDGDSCTSETCVDGLCEYTITAECGGCTVQSDCDDDDLCTDNVCGPQQVCIHTFNEAGCEDGNACTENDTCNEGTCLSGTTLVCDDGDPCTEDSCHILIGCVAAAIDGCIPCGPESPCDDNNPCTNDTCVDSTCSFIIHSNACEDGNACTTGDTCVGGLCLPGDPTPCDDNNECTSDECLPESGCHHPPQDAVPCSPNHPCATDGVCSNSACLPINGDSTCCISDSNCDDGFPCTQDSCNGGECSNTGVSCPADAPCALSYCQAGACIDTGPSPDSTQHSVFLENFDDGWANGWSMESTNEKVGWTTSTAQSFSGSTSLYVGNPEALSYDFGDTEAKTVTPPIWLPDGDLTLQFRQWSDVEEQHCFGDLLYVVVENMDLLDITVLEPNFCDDTGGSFLLREFSLNGFKGHLVRIWFVFDTYDSQQNDAVGMFIDDISITASTDTGCCATDQNCDDNDPCTNQYCDTELGCLYSACSETNPCDDPTCEAQTCEPPDCCINDAECDDNFACTVDKCSNEKCTYQPVICPPAGGCVDFCYQGACMSAGPGAGTQGQYIYFESFDDGLANGWSFSSDNNDVYWGINTTNANSLPFSLYAGNPETLSYDFGTTEAVAKSPLLSLPNTPLVLRFQQWGDVEEDHCFSDILYVVAVSSTGGIPSQTLTPTVCESTDDEFIEREYDLSALGGANVQLFFGFATYDGFQNDGTGLYLDDIGVLTFPSSPPCD